MTDVSSSKRLHFELLHERCMHVRHLSLGLLLLALFPLPASGEEMRWEGTLELDLVRFAPMIFAGSGVATISSSGGGTRLEDLRIAGGITGVGTIPFTDPDISASNRSIRISPQLGTGTLGPFWPVEPWPESQLNRNTLPVKGSLRICMFFSGCLGGTNTPLSQHSGKQAVGVGGTLTEGGFGALRISIEAAPWTVYSTTLVVNTAQGGTTHWIRSGWIHGPFSSSSSAATTGGALQLVTPLVLRSNTGVYLPVFTSLTIRFVPEPGFLLLMGSGIIGLMLLGRTRRQQGVPWFGECEFHRSSPRPGRRFRAAERARRP